MFGKLKDALNNSYVWLLALLSTIAVLWFKERDLEDKLEEAKADAKIKDAKEAVSEADSHAADSGANYASVRAEYLKDHPND